MIDLKSTDAFRDRHIGPDDHETKQMLGAIGVSSVDELISQTVPPSIRRTTELALPAAQSEYNYLKELRKKAQKNKIYKNYIGVGYYGNITPAVIRRNVFENPGWYTQYTPYQAEIAQGRLEALLNFQTMVVDLTGLPIANASLLDEGTAAAEAMHLFWGVKNKKDAEFNKFFVSNLCLPQTIDVVKSRAGILEIEVVVGDHKTATIDQSYFGALIQYPAVDGNVFDYKDFTDKCHAAGCAVTVACDLMALTLLTPPGEWGADCAIGNSQRFGVPMGYGGPHAAFFAITDEHKRIIPGRIIGVSVDAQNNPALRMALQTREQHIRREKATSNICTAQALLSIMSSMYAVYHGPHGVKNIALRIHTLASVLKSELKTLGYTLSSDKIFDTVTIDTAGNKDLFAKINTTALRHETNFYYSCNNFVSISVDETHQPEDIADVLAIFAEAIGKSGYKAEVEKIAAGLDIKVERTSTYMTHPVFNTHHSESNLMRYIKSLENKDLSLTKSMIPLGSCTMKLNAAAELEPVSWAEFGGLHPFCPVDQAAGYQEIIRELESYLSEITGFAATSLQPNSGAQGEYAGIQVIRAYQKDIGQGHRDIALIPASAHGTNPATAVMCGCKVVVVATDDKGNINFDDLVKKVEEHKDNLCCLMVTYPSTHGVFEDNIKDVCALIHANGGQVYMDGANLNAQVGLTGPGFIGADVNHINLHKTFAIPHGGGGPGMGPICVAAHLAPYLPGNPLIQTGGEKAIHAVSSAPYGSASILLISYGYIRMLGPDGCKKATQYAILNANYIKARLEDHYPVLYTGASNGRVAHELIIEFRHFKHTVGIEVEDVAKRLMDYGFHAPTVSFPVAGTLMIEPTESEDKAEIDRFCDALISIKGEIEKIQNKTWDATDNPLKNAPHTVEMLTAEEWNHGYTRKEAAYPLPWVKEGKFWPSVARINNSFGDRNLVCTCPDVASYA
ncbi:MAG: aminomethyl-transferring glycine dehydrogenase [Bacteroidetes bacterium]|nr:aminomethyl-transferring glycine dehydrogenase [Bacteroidota bacterium]